MYFKEEWTPSLKELYHHYKRRPIAIVTHKNSDVDAVVSAMLLKHAFQQASLYIPDKMNYPATKLLQSLQHLYGLLFQFKTFSQASEEDIIIVDTTGNLTVPPEKRIIAIFDHHDPRAKKYTALYEFINPEAPANAILVREALFHLSISQPRWLDVITAIALISDTNRFDRGDSLTFSTMGDLLKKLEEHQITYGELKRLAFPPPDATQLDRIIYLLKNPQVVEVDKVESLGDSLPPQKSYLFLKQDNTPFGVVEKIPADKTLSPGDITSNIQNLLNLPFILYYKKEEEGFRLSIRTLPPWNAVEFMKKYLGCTVNCGGHPNAGGGTFDMEEKEFLDLLYHGIKEEIKNSSEI
ncbi:MAG: hypothetical protein GXN92_00245 [Candidatus Micrarchaeota archaeon]|nr:hypothetical protein [Candidatus Micrarchaeota archaeon]